LITQIDAFVKAANFYALIALDIRTAAQS